MTCARREIVDDDEVGIYHCVSRCVRRAFLCGRDHVTGRSFKHRRRWIRSRLRDLAQIFALEVIAYAIMSNHLHTVLRIRPDLARSWSPEEVAKRWRLLFPLRRINGNPAEPSKEEIQAIVLQPEKVELYRKRLSSLSWFNRCLNEKIARRANAEDDCKGRFWEGRFKCQRVFDLAGLFACAAYVDLNPIRAGIAETLEGSDHTSIQDRIHDLEGNRPARCQDWETIPLLSIPEVSGNALSATDYLKLVDQTGRLIREGKNSIPDDVAPILERLRINPEHWVETTEHLRKKFRRVIGPAEFIEAQAVKAKKLWLHGVRFARAVFQVSRQTPAMAKL